MESAIQLLNECLPNSGEDGCDHQRRVSSIRRVVEFVVTAAVALRDNICVDGGSEAHDSSTWFDSHSAVTCMGFALEIEYVSQHEQCLTLVFSQFGSLLMSELF